VDDRPRHVDDRPRRASESESALAYVPNVRVYVRPPNVRRVYVQPVPMGPNYIPRRQVHPVPMRSNYMPRPHVSPVPMKMLSPYRSG
jgi:hypothetical protein